MWAAFVSRWSICDRFALKYGHLRVYCFTHITPHMHGNCLRNVISEQMWKQKNVKKNEKLAYHLTCHLFNMRTFLPTGHFIFNFISDIRTIALCSCLFFKNWIAAIPVSIYHIWIRTLLPSYKLRNIQKYILVFVLIRTVKRNINSTYYHWQIG